MHWHLLKWLYPGMKFKRWLLLFAVGVFLVSLGLALVFNYKYLDQIEEAIFRFVYMWRGSYDYTATALVGTVIVLLGAAIMLVATRFVIRSVILVLLPENSGNLVDLIYEKRMLGRGPSIAVIGGGHGLSVLLRGIKEATSNVTAIVTVADDGGGSGVLREELGMPPPGDIRACILALIPGDVIDAAMHQCDLTLKAQQNGVPIEERRSSMIKAFEEFGITPEQLAAFCQKQSANFIDETDIKKLRRVYTSFKDGLVGVDYFTNRMQTLAAENAAAAQEPAEAAPAEPAPAPAPQAEEELPFEMGGLDDI